MSRPSHRQITLDELISLAEDSPANPTAPQESGLEKTMNATYGQRCLTLSEPFVPVGSWARMFADLLIGMEGWSSRRCALTWKIQGTPSNRIYYQLLPSALPTDATEFGLLLTPTTSEQVQDLDKFKARMEKYPNGTTMPNLATQVLSLLPTPIAGDWKGQRRSDGTASMLSGKAGLGLLPTPMACEGDKITGKETQDSLTKRFRDGTPSQLNPRFVAEMMGFPVNWTELPFQSGDQKA